MPGSPTTCAPNRSRPSDDGRAPRSSSATTGPRPLSSGPSPRASCPRPRPSHCARWRLASARPTCRVPSPSSSRTSNASPPRRLRCLCRATSAAPPTPRIVQRFAANIRLPVPGHLGMRQRIAVPGQRDVSQWVARSATRAGIDARRVAGSGRGRVAGPARVDLRGAGAPPKTAMLDGAQLARDSNGPTCVMTSRVHPAASALRSDPVSAGRWSDRQRAKRAVDGAVLEHGARAHGPERTSVRARD